MTPLCQAEALSVRYDHKLANDAVSLSLQPGEVLALLGENGAGKSTLLHALYGLAPVCAGVVRYRGVAVQPTPERAIAAGIGLIHQHFLLVHTLSVAENIVLGCEPKRFGLLDRRKAIQQVEALSAAHGLPVDPNRRVNDLSVGEAQRVEILKALYRGANVLLLDEPTAVLTPGEASHLLFTLRDFLQQPGQRALLIVTHKLDEVMQVADRAVIMRAGRVEAEFARSEFSAAAMARAMVGREVVAVSRRQNPTVADPGSPAALTVQGLSVERDGVAWVQDVSFSVPAGSIVGVAGVAGNGQSELIAAIAGLCPARSGSIRLGNREVLAASARTRQKLGLAVVHEDRLRHGVVSEMNLAENLLLTHEDSFCKGPGGMLLDGERLTHVAGEVLAQADVRPADLSARLGSLSGGNQQKLVMARALKMTGLLPKVLVAAQPTRGVDVLASENICQTLLWARHNGCAILLFSSELKELQALSDRILVMYRGRIIAQAENDVDKPVSRQQLGEWMTGVGASAYPGTV